jgi:hypothetical protein
MTEAMCADSSAVRPVKDRLGLPAPTVIDLFRQWCEAVKYVAPAAWPEEAKAIAYCESGDRAEEIYETIAERYRREGGQPDALLWIVFFRMGEFVDQSNPVLPHAERAPWHREMVDALAAQNPDLARVAGIAA